MNVSFLHGLLNTVAEQTRQLLPWALGSAEHDAVALKSRRGEVSCVAVARPILNCRRTLNHSVSAAGLAALLLAATLAPVAAADPSVENGEEIFKKCRACHDVGPNAKNKIGPLLNDLFGRKAGTIEGFNYSDANRKAGESGWVWTEEKLMTYLANPREAMPGNKMAFAGLRDEQERRDLIAYLKTFSK